MEKGKTREEEEEDREDREETEEREGNAAEGRSQDTL